MATRPPPTEAGRKLLEELRQERRQLRRDALLTAVTGVGLAVGVALQLLDGPGRAVAAAFVVAYLAGGLPASVTAARALLRRHLDIDLLMVVAALAAAAVGEPRDGAILLFLFRLAETLEDYALGNTKRAVAALMTLRPDTARRRRPDGEVEEVPVEALEPGDEVLVQPGERLPADGRVLEGRSALDQSPITGESLPVDKAPGDEVYAGTVNGHGALAVRVGKRASESTLARMIELVTEARAQRSPSERVSEWFGRRYTAGVLVGSALALGAFLLLGLPSSEAFYKAATLLVVASPCAVVISVPAAVLSALAAAARRGVLFKGGAALEDLGAAEAVAFDKTGTLTEGRMRLTDVVPFGLAEPELLRLAAGLEARSEHPLARSVVRAAEARGLEPPAAGDVAALPGLGLTGEVEGAALWAGNRTLALQRVGRLPAEVETALTRLAEDGKSIVLVGRERVLGLLGIADAVRPSAAPALRALREAGVERLAMLTGDHDEVARAVAREIGLDEAEVYAELLPEDKLERVRRLSEAGPIAFVGDGVNDAAALAAAGVGVAMGSAGSDVALETADVALLSDDLERLPEAYALARRARRIIRQNLVFALGIMAVMVVLTLFWRLPLPLGVLGHEGGTIIVVLNGLRLLLAPSPRRGTPPPEGRPALAP